ncbi:MAG TPA: hypothetical protein VFL62_20000 [Bradyrhizobium sp.]|uniref:hypothetical protein n=1 Tax=Bradyrhizobium sp. TaxID=376 RepID=UPI002D8075E0|nr:hypothetical protein [Bradyrhizobium sp.]HET7888513.1 hypothetical protein [Bradyrhizobium sp.]
MMIARRADTRARADFATWTMMAKLNGTSALPPAAQSFLERYKTLLKEKNEAEASEAIILLIYQSYYEEMGGAGQAPEVKPRPSTASTSDNVTAFKRPPAQRPKTAGGPQQKSKLPVALIFACLVVVYTAFRYLWR